MTFNIPQRWSVAHLYAVLYETMSRMSKDIAYLTTLAGYVHWKLTGERKVLGVGDASGMFPIDSAYQAVMTRRMLDGV